MPLLEVHDDPPSGSSDLAESEDGDSRRAENPQRWKGVRALKALRRKLDLDLETVLMMAKGALPPAIAAAVVQSSSVANTFTTLGYLISIMAFFSLCTQPRAKFVETMLLNVLGVCILAATTLLSIFCAVKARENTMSAEDPSVKMANTIEVPYNSSASAVIAVWFCITIYIINVIRASKPQLAVTGTILSFFTIVASVNATRIPNIKAGEALVKHMLGAFLTGFAIAVGVSLLIFPRTSRKTCFKLTGVFMGHLKESLNAQGMYMRRMRRKNILFTCVQETNVSIPKREADEIRATCSPEAAKLKEATASLVAVFGRMHTELDFAKKEIAYGRLDAYDIKKVYAMLQSILLPMNGISTLVDILKEVAIRAAGSEDDPEREILNFDDIKAESDAWKGVMDSLLNSFDSLSEALGRAVDHVYGSLRFHQHRRRKTDAEKDGTSPDFSDHDFAAYLSKRLDDFDKSRIHTLRTWSRAAGVALPTAFLTDPSEEASNVPRQKPNETIRLRKNQQRLYLILYIEFLTWSIGKGILDLVQFADCKSEEAFIRGKRLILPGRKRITKWMKTILHDRDSDSDPTIEGPESTQTIVHLGEAYKARKDPEHLPPDSVWEAFGDYIRHISHFFASSESAFGFRAVCAVMTVAIVGFLKNTQTWFLEQRGLWAVIIVSISLAPTTGASFIGFLGRAFATICATGSSITLWYMADEKVGGTIPLLWFFLFIGFYFIFKFPRWAVGALLFNVTQLLIVGYELEVTKLGVSRATGNGQLYYPIYLLGPYRLATVITGTFVAFFWSYFPFPVTSHGTLRRNLGSALYLLANYYATVHATVELRLLDTEFDVTAKGSPARKLEKARTRVYAKLGIQFARLRGLAGEWEPSLGGRFPSETYDEIIRSMQTIFNYMTLISYSTRTFSPPSPPSSLATVTTTETSPEPWIHSFRTFIRSLTIMSHDITSMLSLLSASVTNAQPLPPYLRVPAPYHLGENLEITNPEILGIEHVTEPCYSAFAVCQVASSLVSEELERLVGLIKILVGEVDFSFHVESTLDAAGKERKGKQE